MFFGWIPSPTKFPRDSCFSQPHHNKHMVAITLPLHNPPSCKEQMRTLKVPTAHVLLQKHLFFLVTWCNHQPPRVDGRVFVLGSELGFPKADWLTLVISHSYQLGNPIQVDIPSLWVCLFFFLVHPFPLANHPVLRFSDIIFLSPSMKKWSLLASISLDHIRSHRRRSIKKPI